MNIMKMSYTIFHMFLCVLIIVFNIGIVVLLLYKLHFKQKKQIEYESKCRMSYLMRENTMPIYTGKIFINYSFIILFYVNNHILTATEWQGRKLETKLVIIVLNKRKQQLEVKNQFGNIIRALDFAHNNAVTVFIVIIHLFI